MKSKGAIGILGGMAPQSSVYMYKLLIDLSIELYGAKDNSDFPEIILYSIPVPDIISNGKDESTVYDILIDRVENLNKLDISYLSIACNTAHLLIDDLQRISKVPFISMVDQVVATVRADKVKRVGVLGSPFTLQSRLYQNAFQSSNITSVVPPVSWYGLLERVIRNILKGTPTENDAKALSGIADELYQQGAEGIILGCTELPLIFPLNKGLRIYNPVKILSLALLENYYG